ncbi:MAG: putative sulfate exporter family transporter [Saprospiraceae bacterium]|nr:putative sulfate exporter family transporter [Saprospiraceae bacterium]
MAKKNNAGESVPMPAKANSQTGFWARLTEDAWANIIGGSLVAGVLLWVFALQGGKPVAPVYAWANADVLFGKVLHWDNLSIVALSGVVFALLSSVAVKLSGGSLPKYLAGFFIIFGLAIFSMIAAGNSGASAYGIEYVIFALLAGILLNNLFKLPEWLKTAARSEFFIKTGLIILGTSVLFTDIIRAGFPGILQAIAVVSVVWFFSLWLSRRLKVDDEFGVILASAVSICGVSAAIVASGAIQGDKKKLSYVTTLVLLMAIPMLILQPWAIHAFGISEIVGGAWLGGTLDTTASVTAAAEQVGPAATKAGVIVKFSQNVLLGVAAFFIATWWVLKKSPEAAAGQEKPGLKLIWERFPKFVLGFILVSLIFSFLIPLETVKQASGFLNSLRTLWFALAFVAIGLEARFSDLLKTQGGRPALVFIGAQLFNIVWTLLWSYLLFGGILLAVPDIK